MTPDAQAAADRLTAYLHLTEAPDRINTDLRTLLAALDRTGQPCGATTIGLLDIPLRPCISPFGHAGAHRNDDGTTWTDRPDRHQPLTDQPCGVVPTERGRQAVLDYHAIRQQQNPRGADQ